MEEIFKQYGGPIITALVVVGIVVIVGILLASGADGGIIIDAFRGLINNFSNKADNAINSMATILMMM